MHTAERQTPTPELDHYHAKRDFAITSEPKGPPSRLRRFEGTIPPKQHGAGTVMIWNRGTTKQTIAGGSKPLGYESPRAAP